MKRKKILVTGSAGYIGSHTALDLLENGINVVGIDDHSRSTVKALKNIDDYFSTTVPHFAFDLCEIEKLRAVFQKHSDIDAIVHFAAYKSVNESVQNPLLYYRNNLLSLINLLSCTLEFNVKNFVFSSSCAVYGSPEAIPVTEKSPLRKVESPYGATKQMGEQIIRDFVVSNPGFGAVLLRYFNLAGAHPSGLIGEQPVGKPQNLVPAITQNAIGKLQGMQV